MAWTSLSFAFNSLLTSTKMTQLYDNITAVADGDSGAPRVATAGLQEPASGTTNTILTLLGSSEITTSETSYLTSSAERSVDRTRHFSVVALVPGVITCEADHRCSAGTSYLRVLKNSTVEQEWTTTSTSFVSRTVDVTVATGDLVAFQQNCLTVSGDTSGWRNISIKSNNPDFAVA